MKQKSVELAFKRRLLYCFNINSEIHAVDGTICTVVHDLLMIYPLFAFICIADTVGKSINIPEYLLLLLFVYCSLLIICCSRDKNSSAYYSIQVKVLLRSHGRTYPKISLVILITLYFLFDFNKLFN